MATIRKKVGKNGTTYEVQIRRKVNGRRTNLTKTFPKWALADRWATAKEEELQGSGDTRPANNTLLTDLCDRYVEHIVPSHDVSSHVTDKSRIGHIRRFCAKRAITLAGLNIDHILEYVDERLLVVESDSIRRELCLWSDVIESARSLWKLHIVANPVENAKRVLRKLRKLKPGNQRERRLRPGEYEKIRDAKHSHFTLINQVALFAIETAMRQSEIASLQWEHVDLSKRLLHITKSKTDWKTGKSGRVIPLSSVAVHIIESLPVRFLDGSVFGMKQASIKRAFIRLCAHEGIQTLRFHDLRREAISRLFERGLALEQVALISGHKTWSQLKRYTALKAEDLIARLG
jgi:integrase